MACLKKPAIATRNKTAAGAKQAAQLTAIGVIRPDSAGDCGPEDDGADLVLARSRLFEVKGPEYVRPACHLFRRNEFRLPGPDRERGRAASARKRSAAAIRDSQDWFGSIKMARGDPFRGKSGPRNTDRY